MRQLSLLIFFFLLQCSSDFVGGTSSTDNPKVMGIIVDNENIPTSNVEVLILPINFNPITDNLTTSGDKDTTDLYGRFELFIPDTGKFNIQSHHFESNKYLLKRNILVDSDELIIDTLFLSKPGALKIILSESIDTSNSYTFIKGTSYYEDLSNIEIDSNNKKYTIFNNVPTGHIPEISYWNEDIDSADILFSDSIKISSNDTLIINLDSLSKTSWNFPCIVGVTQQSADYFGGIENITDSILNQFNSVNYTFNESGLFKGIFNFTVDSIYVIVGDVNHQAIKPPAKFAFRVIYDGFKEGSLVANSFVDSWIYHSYSINDEGGMFGDKSENILNWLFGLIRGAKPLDDVNVLAENNYLNNQNFIPMESIMSNPEESAPWDSYNINLLNHYKDEFIIQDIKHTAFPSSMGIYVESAAGFPIENAEIKLYGILIDMGTVDSNSVILSGKTSVNGEFEFQKNPYLNNDLNIFLYDNILISVVNNNSVTWAWLPFYEPSNSWFANPDSAFRKKVTIP